jgi:ribosome-associated protein
MDEDNDDGLGGRSRDRRDVTQANRWSRPLCALDPVRLAAAPVPDEVMAEIRLARSLESSYAARDRAYRRIDKLVRGLEEAEVDALDAFLANPDAGQAMLDGWIDRLVKDGDPVVEAWVEGHPGTDRQRLRTLVRNVKSGKGTRDALRAALAESLEG